jgi:hypothetical protein
MVEHSPHHPKVKGSCLPVTLNTGREEVSKNSDIKKVFLLRSAFLEKFRKIVVRYFMNTNLVSFSQIIFKGPNEHRTKFFPTFLGFHMFWPKNIWPKDVWPKDIWPKDVWLKNVWPKDVWPKDIWPKDVWPNEVWPKDIWPKDICPKDILMEDVWPKDVCLAERCLAEKNLADRHFADPIFGQHSYELPFG